MDRQYSAKPDIAQMSETPKRGSHHRRAHSDTTFRLDDFLLFDPSDLDLSSIELTPNPDLPSPSPLNNDSASPFSFPMAVDSSSKSDDSSTLKPRSSGLISHFRSLSVDSDFFDNIGFAAEAEKPPVMEKRGYQHRHSNSMDGSSSMSFEADSMGGIDGMKKAMPADRLAELSLIDPKRAKRILANRQSAARSKERKIRYTGELERKVQTLQTEATTLSAQVTMLQRDTSGLTTENKELKMRLQAMEQQAHLRDALNETLREEVQRLKIATGQIPPNSNSFNRGLPAQYSSHQPQLHQFGGHQAQQHHQQQHLHMPQPSNNNQTQNGQPHVSFTDFNQRI